MEASMTCDLIVIGGGPAGCAAAISAARLGASVLILERGRFPRHKVCGEFVSSESVAVLHDLLSPGQRDLVKPAPRIARGRIFIDGAVLPAEISPPAVSIARFDLDSALWESCVASGALARDAMAVRGIEGSGPFRVITADDVLEAEAVVNATGRWSNLTSEATRAHASGKRWLGIKAHFADPEPSSSVDLYFFDGGYCGVQPLSFEEGMESRINACAMIRSAVATSMDAVLSCHPALYQRSRKWKPVTAPVTTSPLVFHEPEPVNEFVLQVGDAAAFVDPFVGDGISLALRSGVLAAECLKRFFAGDCSLAGAMEAYRTAYMGRLAPVFRSSSRLRRMLRWPGVIRKPAVSLLQKAPLITRQIVRMTR
jgi:menaquinone-9 beta-reductase